MSPVPPSGRPRPFVRVALAAMTACLAGCGSTVAGSSVASSQPGDSGLSAGVPAGSAPGAAATVGSGTAGAGDSSLSVPVAPGAAAGSGQSLGGAEGDTSTSVPGAPSTTTTHGPIQVGFVASDFTKTAAAFGFGAASSPQRWFQYLVKYYNANGGLGGRRIDPVYSTVDGASSDWSNASQSVCSELTEDNHVELAVSNLWVNATLTNCLLKAGVPQFEGTHDTLNDSNMMAQTPNLFIPAGLTTDREGAAVVSESVRLGLLTKNDKLGILYDGCDYSVRGVQEGAIPTAERLDIPYFAINAYDCGGGFADVSSFSAGIQNAELRMNSEGVTKVMFITQGENGALVFFSNDAESQHWRPTYLVSSNVMMRYSEDQGTMQHDQMVNVHGIGWEPPSDVDNAPVTAQMRACSKHVHAAGGPTPTTVGDELAMYAACNAVFVADTALRASGGLGGLAALQPAVEGLGTTFTSLATVDGDTRFGPGRHDGTITVAPFAYVAKCKCFQYVGPPHRIP